MKTGAAVVVIAAIEACTPVESPSGPSPEQLRCTDSCARDKDACMLHATSAPEVRACDDRSSQCSRGCGL
jgi:hypothetical protein